MLQESMIPLACNGLACQSPTLGSVYILKRHVGQTGQLVPMLLPIRTSVMPMGNIMAGAHADDIG